VQIKVLLGIEQHVGDTLSGMVRNGVIVRHGRRPSVRYVVKVH